MTPPHTAAETARLAQIEAADWAPEALRSRVIATIAEELDALGLTPGWYYADRLADAALAVVQGHTNAAALTEGGQA